MKNIDLQYFKDRLILDFETSKFYSKKTGKPVGAIEKYGYERICLERKFYFSHRLVWLFHFGKFPKGQIDHINQIKTDNRIDNLRDVSCAENLSFKTKPSSHNKTGFRGVYKRKNRFSVYFINKNSLIRRNGFLSAEDAHKYILEIKGEVQ